MDERRIPFSKEDEERIASAALWGMIVALGSIASSVLSLVLAIARTPQPTQIVSQLISLTITALLGIWLYQASVAFRQVARSDLADQHYLLEGFRKLRAYFMTTGILIIIAMVIGVLAFLGAMMCALTARSFHSFR